MILHLAFTTSLHGLRGPVLARPWGDCAYSQAGSLAFAAAAGVGVGLADSLFGCTLYSQSYARGVPTG